MNNYSVSKVKKREPLSNIGEFCKDNDISMPKFRKALIDRGMTPEIKRGDVYYYKISNLNKFLKDWRA